jgi:hypothetical protein
VAEKGVMSSDKGTIIPEEKKLPYAPENKNMSKAEFQEAQRKRKEKELKLAEVAAQIDKEQGIVKDEPKKAGRPKKIE